MTSLASHLSDELESTTATQLENNRCVSVLELEANKARQFGDEKIAQMYEIAAEKIRIR